MNDDSTPSTSTLSLWWQGINTCLLLCMLAIILMGCSSTVPSPFQRLPVQDREQIVVECEQKASQSTAARNVERFVPIGGDIGGDVTRLLGEGKCRESLAKLRHDELLQLAESAREREAREASRAFDQATYEDRILLDNCYSCTRSADEFCLAKLRCAEAFPDMAQFAQPQIRSREDALNDLRGTSSGEAWNLSTTLEACIGMFETRDEERACIVGRLMNDK